MILLVNIFFILIKSEILYKILTPDNFDHITKGPIPTIVRFFSNHRKYSVKLDEQYDLVTMLYKDIDAINVAAINCGKYRYFCYDKGVSMTPFIKLYTKNGTYDYEGGMSHESISRWATGYTGVHFKELNIPLKRPNGKVFKEMLNSTYCVFTMFYHPNYEANEYIKSLKIVAEAFKYDKKVEIVANDVDLYKFYNWDYTLNSFPDIKLFCMDENAPIKYTSTKDPQDMIDFINDYCGTQRDINGRLSSEAGIIDEVSQIVEDFITKSLDKRYISDMEQFEGTDYYINVMNEIIKNGISFVSTEKERLNNMIITNSVDPEKIDEFQIRINILGVFSSYIE